MLREATHSAHMLLEDEIGSFSNLPDYVAYLRGLSAFRASLEPVLATWVADLPDFEMTALAPLLQQDMDDLGCEPIAPPLPIGIDDSAGALGALYVVEGSALGARLLVKRVQPLGLSPDYGARHLSRQATSLKAWRRLVEILDKNDYCPMRAVAAANTAFGLAQTCMKRSRHG